MMKRVITICNANVPPLCLLTAVAPRIPSSRSQMDLGFEPEEYPRGMLSLFTRRHKEFCAKCVYCHSELRRCIQTCSRSCSARSGRAGHRGWLSAYLAESCLESLEVQHVRCMPVHSLRQPEAVISQPLPCKWALAQEDCKRSSSSSATKTRESGAVMECILSSFALLQDTGRPSVVQNS